jgi:SAM-dependent methyltransferase
VNPRPTSYDEVPYESHPFPESHPERLATIASLFSLKPPPIDRCRVLELGCASEGNLIPMAFNLPGSSFVRVELSTRQAAQGRQAIRELALGNVEIRQADILDIDGSWGQFDYVIAHGVFSWVPRPVQDKILQVCSANLADNGVAYVSYNTYPGWHMYGMLRDMMLYHAGRFEQPARKVAEARGLLDFLDRWAPEGNDPYGLLLKKGAGRSAPVRTGTSTTTTSKR